MHRICHILKWKNIRKYYWCSSTNRKHPGNALGAVTYIQNERCCSCSTEALHMSIWTHPNQLSNKTTQGKPRISYDVMRWWLKKRTTVICLFHYRIVLRDHSGFHQSENCLIGRFLLADYVSKVQSLVHLIKNMEIKWIITGQYCFNIKKTNKQITQWMRLNDAIRFKQSTVNKANK